MTAYDPDGKQWAKSIRADAYTKKQLEEIYLSYRNHIHSGKPFEDFIYKKPFEMEEVVVQEEKPVKSMKSHFDFRSIDCITMPDNNCLSWLCIGSTKSGKSYAINYIWETYFKKHITFLMSLSAHHEIYNGFRKKAVISEGFCTELIDEPMKINKLTKNHYSFCVITDDLALDGKNSPAMIKLLTIGRNSGMSFIGGIQKATLLNATGRTNVNMVCCFWLNTDTEIEATIKTFLRSYFPKGLSMPEMISMYRDLTKDHQFICFDTLNGECFLSKI
jgi:hypothetical protein